MPGSTSYVNGFYRQGDYFAVPGSLVRAEAVSEGTSGEMEQGPTVSYGSQPLPKQSSMTADSLHRTAPPPPRDC